MILPRIATLRVIRISLRHPDELRGKISRCPKIRPGLNQSVYLPVARTDKGRLGIDIHATAGKGDVGFCNHWTLEISCTQPVRVYAGMPIGQLIYFQVAGEISRYYNTKLDAKYNERTIKPMESKMWKNFLS